MVAGWPLVNCVCMLISGAYEHYSAVVPQIIKGKRGRGLWWPARLLLIVFAC